MKHSERISVWAAMTALIVMMAGMTVRAAPDTSPGGPIVGGTWQHHHASFNYFGITALYSCDGLESNVRALLLHLGARKDAKVTARGCPYGSSIPSRNAIVDVDFDSLAPSTDANGVTSVQARWTPVTVGPTHPSFMGRGDCELIEQLKDVLSKNFSLRDLVYRTDCVPHEVNIDDFSIKAEVLKPVPAAVASTAPGG